MKQILILLTLIGLITMSCNDSEMVVISKKDLNKLKGDTLPQRKLMVNDATYEISVGSDGHDYYGMILGTGGYDRAMKYFHLPSCTLCAKSKKDSL